MSLVLRDEAARFAVARRRDYRARRVDTDTAGRARKLAVRHGRRPVTSTWDDYGYADARRVLEAVAADQGRGGRVVRRIREERFLSRHEVTKVGLHGGHVRLRLRVGKLRDRDRGQDADDDDHDQQLDERKALSGAKHVGHGRFPDGDVEGVAFTLDHHGWSVTTLWSKATPAPAHF